jgi:hypothetical protein
MLRVVLSAPTINRADAIGHAPTLIDAQRHLWAAGARLTKYGAVEPHAWIDAEGQLRDGLRLTMDCGRSFFLHVEVEDTDVA